MADFEKTPIKPAAIIFGVTGLVGKELARKLSFNLNWKVYGIARKPEIIPTKKNSNYQFISCDLLNPFETQIKLCGLDDVTHIYWVTWASQFPLDSHECCDQNKAMMLNAFNVVIPNAKALKHVCLQTGMKHYISLEGPFEKKEVCYYSEECSRVNGGHNFYYMLEDLVREKVLERKIAWSVHRPGLLIGSSYRSLYNFMGSLCVYGSICKYLNLPFVFGGTKECWEEICIDGSDVRLVAEQQIWVSTNEETFDVNGEAYNAINGSSFTWREIWPYIGRKFGLEVWNEMYSEDLLYANVMNEKKSIWEEVVMKEGLVGMKMEDLANWEFLDMLFRCPFKLLGTREKVDRVGFTMRHQTLDSILYWIDIMRDEKLIP